jgi:hypothetical protein
VVVPSESEGSVFLDHDKQIRRLRLRMTAGLNEQDRYLLHPENIETRVRLTKRTLELRFLSSFMSEHASLSISG